MNNSQHNVWSVRFSTQNNKSFQYFNLNNWICERGGKKYTLWLLRNEVQTVKIADEQKRAKETKKLMLIKLNSQTNAGLF